MYMYHKNASLFPQHFMLGPFEVICYPYMRGLYDLYVISANGVTVRKQISYPDEWSAQQGLAQTMQYKEVLSSGDWEKLKQFVVGHGFS